MFIKVLCRIKMLPE